MSGTAALLSIAHGGAPSAGRPVARCSPGSADRGGMVEFPLRWRRRRGRNRHAPHERRKEEEHDPHRNQRHRRQVGGSGRVHGAIPNKAGPKRKAKAEGDPYEAGRRTAGREQGRSDPRVDQTAFGASVIVTAMFIPVPAPGFAQPNLSRPTRTADIGNGITLHYLDEGKGAPVIFVHGWISDADYWAAEIQPFARHYRAIAYSRRYNYPNVNRARRGYSAVVAAEDLGCARRHPESRQGRDSRPFVRRLDHRRSRSGCCFWKGRGWAAPAGTTAHGCRLRRIRVILHSLRYLLTVVEH